MSRVGELSDPGRPGYIITGRCNYMRGIVEMRRMSRTCDSWRMITYTRYLTLQAARFPWYEFLQKELLSNYFPLYPESLKHLLTPLSTMPTNNHESHALLLTNNRHREQKVLWFPVRQNIRARRGIYRLPIHLSLVDMCHSQELTLSLRPIRPDGLDP